MHASVYITAFIDFGCGNLINSQQDDSGISDMNTNYIRILVDSLIDMCTKSFSPSKATKNKFNDELKLTDAHLINCNASIISWSLVV